MLFDFSKKKNVLTYELPTKTAVPKKKKEAQAQALDKLDRMLIETKDMHEKPNAFSHIQVKDAQKAVMVDGNTKLRTNTISLYDQLMTKKSANTK
ncbi:hypothetical protein NECID01_0802 [Nematocida sp. AWRm77]|nr:hypothetical protein NECID01_0802 [Nematocida sp. AWRm77]